MKFTSYLLICAAITCITACQKSVGWAVDPLTNEVLDSSANVQSLGNLANVVSTSNTGSMEHMFTYDSLGRIITERESGTIEGSKYDDFKRYERDTLGRIVNIAAITYTSIDTTYTEVYYDDERTPNFLRAVHVFEEAGISVRDSAVYTYDGNGNIAIEKVFRKSLADYQLFARNEFAYNNGNLISLKNYIDTSNNGGLALAASCHFSYDSQINPLYRGIEAMLASRPVYASRNNQLKMAVDEVLAPAIDHATSTSFVYSRSRQPVAATSTSVPDSTKTRYTFSYR